MEQKYQTEVMAIVGLALVAVQEVEGILAACWLAFSKRGMENGETYFEIDDLDYLLEKNKRKTLGQLFFEMRKTGIFTDEFESRFNDYVESRNFFIHKLFKDTTYSNISEKQSLEKTHGFASHLISESFYFREIFDNYLGVMYELLHRHEDWDVKGIDKLREIMDERQKNGSLRKLFAQFK